MASDTMSTEHSAIRQSRVGPRNPESAMQLDSWYPAGKIHGRIARVSGYHGRMPTRAILADTTKVWVCLFLFYFFIITIFKFLYTIRDRMNTTIEFLKGWTSLQNNMTKEIENYLDLSITFMCWNWKAFTNIQTQSVTCYKNLPKLRRSDIVHDSNDDFHSSKTTY